MTLTESKFVLILTYAMHAYLITGQDKENTRKKAEEIAKKLKLKIFEFPAAKIDDVRELNRFATLSLSVPTGILIDIDGATDEALNAFLKNLEEPQENLFFFLTASSIHKVLPTIASRCLHIKAFGEKAADSESTQKFLEKSSDEKLLYVDRIKERQEALAFVEDLTLGLHSLLLSSQNSHLTLSKYLRVSGETLERLNANGNVTLQLTNMVLNFS